MSVFLGVPRTKWQPLVDGRDGRSRDPSSTSPDQVYFVKSVFRV